MICKFHASMTSFRFSLSARFRRIALLTATARHSASPRFVACLISGLVLSAPSHAERADRLQKITIDAGNAVTDLQKQTVVYTGNVVISRGSMVIRAERVEVRQLPSGYYDATAFGSASRPATFRQKREGSDEYIEGEAERLEYDGRADQIKFIDRAQLRTLRGAATANQISGKLITYDANTEKINVSGGSAPTATNPGGRVRAVLSPREDAAATSSSGSTAAPAPLTLSPSLGDRNDSNLKGKP